MRPSGAPSAMLFILNTSHNHISALSALSKEAANLISARHPCCPSRQGRGPATLLHGRAHCKIPSRLHFEQLPQGLLSYLPVVAMWPVHRP